MSPFSSLFNAATLLSNLSLLRLIDSQEALLQVACGQLVISNKQGRYIHRNR